MINVNSSYLVSNETSIKYNEESKGRTVPSVIFLFLIAFFMMYQNLFAGSVLKYADEILILVYFFWAIIYNRKIIVNVFVKSYAIWFVYSLFITMLFSQADFIDAFDSIFNSLKIVLLIISISNFDYTKKELTTFLKIFVVLSIPSIVYGLIQYYQANVLNIWIENGKYEYIDGLWVFRMRGLAAHPIDFANQLVFNCVILACFFKKNIFTILFLVLNFIICYLTYSSLPFYSLLILTLLYVFICFFRKKISTIIYLFIFIILISLLVLTLSNIHIFDIIFENEESTIRYKGISYCLESISKNPLGYGFGTYSHLGYDEAFFFRVLLDNGFIGVALFFFPIVYSIVVSFIKKDYVLCFTCLLLVLVNCLFNQLYILPGILYGTIILMLINKNRYYNV